MGLIEYLLVTAFGATLGFILKLQIDIRYEFRRLNGRMIRIEEWRINHELSDNERHKNLEHDTQLLFEKIV